MNDAARVSVSTRIILCSRAMPTRIALRATRRLRNAVCLRTRRRVRDRFVAY